MYLYLLLCNILFIPIISGSNTKLDHNPAVKSLLQESTKAVGNTNLTIITEGGTAVQSTPPIALPKLNHTVLLSLDSELNKVNLTAPSGSKVVPRKGVVYHTDNTTKPEDIAPVPMKQKLNTTDVNKVTVKPNDKSTHKTTKTIYPQSNLKSTTLKPVKKVPEVHKKPLILSNEALDKIELNKPVVLPKVLSSSNTIVSDQLQSPGKESVLNKKAQALNSSHPGMMMPVVITILVMPMFAVLGYMALKRGQEAWKNRHYKRMDFLLDGMYNE